MNLILSNNNREQLVSQQQQLLQQLANLNQILGENGEQTILEKKKKKQKYSIRNKREIDFDSHT